MTKKILMLLIISILFLGSCAETQSTATKCPLAKKKECDKKKACNQKKECPLTKKCDQKKTCDKKKKFLFPDALSGSVFCPLPVL